MMNGKMVGDILREARINKQLQLTDIQISTGIPTQHLLALELDQFSLIPEEHVEDYLVKFGELLGLDGESLLQQYKEQISFQSTLPHFSSIEPAFSDVSNVDTDEEMEEGERRVHRRRGNHREKKQKKSKLPAIIFSLLGLAIIVLVGYFAVKEFPFFTGSNQETTTESETREATTATTISETTVTEATATPVKVEAQAEGGFLATVKSGKDSVNVVFTLIEGASWVSLNDGVNGDQGTTINAEQKEFTVTVAKGSSSYVTIGILPSTKVTVDGQEIDLSALTGYSPANFTLTVE